MRRRRAKGRAFARFGVGLACTLALTAQSASARPDARLVSADAALPDWIGTVTATYTASGSVDNGNCPGCTATSQDSATVTETVTASGGSTSGNVTLTETNDFNSQCTGTVTRKESDQGTVQDSNRPEITVQPYGSNQYTVGVNPPGISYTGTLQDEQVAVTNNVKSCRPATHPSSGVFYIPGFDGPIIGSGDATTASQLSGSASHSPTPCGYPRTTCVVTYTWNFRRPCIPGLDQQAEKDWAAAHDLFAIANNDLHTLIRESEDDGRYELHNLVAAKGEEALLSKALAAVIEKTASTHALGALGESFELTLAPVMTAYWILNDVLPAMREHDDALNKIKDELDQAVAKAQQAIAEMNRAIEGEPDCATLDAQKQHDQDLLDKAKSLRESWQNNGAIYWSPTRHEWEDAAAALHEAKQILTSQRSLAAATGAATKIRVTAKQVQAALPYLKRAVALIEKAIAQQKHADTLLASGEKTVREVATG